MVVVMLVGCVVGGGGYFLILHKHSEITALRYSRRQRSAAGEQPTPSYLTLSSPNKRSHALRTRSDIATKRLWKPVIDYPSVFTRFTERNTVHL